MVKELITINGLGGSVRVITVHLLLLQVDDVRSESEEPVSEEGDEPKEVEMNNIAMNNVNHVGNAHHVGNSIVANHSHEKSG